MSKSDLDGQCLAIADKVVPAYRGNIRMCYPPDQSLSPLPFDKVRTFYPCTGHIAKRWQAAYDGAAIALGLQVDPS